MAVNSEIFVLGMSSLELLLDRNCLWNIPCEKEQIVMVWVFVFMSDERNIERILNQVLTYFKK